MTDIVDIAEKEIDIFERPSVKTSKLLILEIENLRKELEKCENQKNTIQTKYKNIFQKYKNLKIK
tara:strand:+ start:3365 stop:3559 length:195 start_codon:yes stop_codon:yes gene_type:complete